MQEEISHQELRTLIERTKDSLDDWNIHRKLLRMYAQNTPETNYHLEPASKLEVTHKWYKRVKRELGQVAWKQEVDFGESYTNGTAVSARVCWYLVDGDYGHLKAHLDATDSAWQMLRRNSELFNITDPGITQDEFCFQLKKYGFQQEDN